MNSSLGIWNRADGDEGHEEDERIVCKRCGEGGLHWQEIVKPNGTPGHALFTERNRRHACSGAQPIEDNFGVVKQ